MDTAIRQAVEYGHSKQREIAFLVCHSMLHLYGYDHMTDDEFKRMNDITEELLTENGYTRTGEK
jgi:probable rRNA maturation factor